MLLKLWTVIVTNGSLTLAAKRQKILYFLRENAKHEVTTFSLKERFFS